MSERHVLVARLDNVGDVLLAGPVVRAVAAGGHRVTFLAGPSGRAAAERLPGVEQVVEWEAPWVPLVASPLRPGQAEGLVATLADLALDEALVLTSFHQSPLPLALLLRMAGVGRIAATSVDHAGGLVDERLPYVEGWHEVEQGLSVAAALGHRLPPGDDARLAVVEAAGVEAAGAAPPPPHPYVVVHPTASVPARAIPQALAAGILDALTAAGRPVVLTGSAADRAVTGPLAAGRPDVTDRAGTTDLDGLAALLRAADAVVVGNTGPAHLAAAVGTPVASIFAPVVDPRRWAPWGVPHRLLGQLDIACAGCRARVCPFDGQPCLNPATPAAVLAAVEELSPASAGAPFPGGASPSPTAPAPGARSRASGGTNVRLLRKGPVRGVGHVAQGTAP